MGGGSLLTPLLVIVFGFSPTTAVGTDLLHGAVFKSVGAVRHRRLGTVQARLSGWMFLGSAPMSLVGVAVSGWLVDHYGQSGQSLQTTILGAALLVGGAGMALKSTIRVREEPTAPFRLGRRDRVTAVLIGMGGGFIVGLTSVGSGVFFGLTMLLVFPLKSTKVVGTDVFHAAALLWVAGVGHLLAGNVDLGSVGWLLLGSIPGVLFGSGLTLRLPGQLLRLILTGTLIASGTRLLPFHYAAESALVLLLAVPTTLALLVRSRAPGRTTAEDDQRTPLLAEPPFS